MHCSFFSIEQLNMISALEPIQIDNIFQKIRHQKHKTPVKTGVLFFSREPGRIRTCDRLLRRQMLYPAELRVRTKPLKRIVVSCLSLTGPLRILLWLCREDRTRTCDPLVPNQMRYHLRHFPNLMQRFLAERLGLEPRDASATTA